MKGASSGTTLRTSARADRTRSRRRAGRKAAALRCPRRTVASACLHGMSRPRNRGRLRLATRNPVNSRPFLPIARRSGSGTSLAERGRHAAHHGHRRIRVVAPDLRRGRPDTSERRPAPRLRRALFAIAASRPTRSLATPLRRRERGRRASRARGEGGRPRRSIALRHGAPEQRRPDRSGPIREGLGVEHAHRTRSPAGPLRRFRGGLARSLARPRSRSVRGGRASGRAAGCSRPLAGCCATRKRLATSSRRPSSRRSNRSTRSPATASSRPGCTASPRTPRSCGCVAAVVAPSRPSTSCCRASTRAVTGSTSRPPGIRRPTLSSRASCGAPSAAASTACPRATAPSSCSRDVEERSTAQAAEHLGITETAVKLRLHRARIALRALLDRELADPR